MQQRAGLEVGQERRGERDRTRPPGGGRARARRPATAPGSGSTPAIARGSIALPRSVRVALQPGEHRVGERLQRRVGQLRGAGGPATATCRASGSAEATSALSAERRRARQQLPAAEELEQLRCLAGSQWRAGRSRARAGSGSVPVVGAEATDPPVGDVGDQVACAHHVRCPLTRAIRCARGQRSACSSPTVTRLTVGGRSARTLGWWSAAGPLAPSAGCRASRCGRRARREQPPAGPRSSEEAALDLLRRAERAAQPRTRLMPSVSGPTRVRIDVARRRGRSAACSRRPA